MGLDALDYNPIRPKDISGMLWEGENYRCIVPDCQSHNLLFTVEDAQKHRHILKFEWEKLSAEENLTPSAKKESYRIPIEWRFDLIPPLVIRELAAIYEEGAKKYGPSKYIEKPLPFSVLVNHLMNHLLLYCSGDRSEKHLAKVMWGVATMMTLGDMIDKGSVERSISDLSIYGAGAKEALQKRLDNTNGS